MATESIATTAEELNADELQGAEPKAPAFEQAPAFELNPQQSQAKAEILKFLEAPFSDGWAYCLQGYAGTGKSTTIQQVLKAAQEMKESKRMVFTAPTHKAVKVLARMAQVNGLSVPCATIHSVLGLRVRETEDQIKIEQARQNGMAKNAMVNLDAIVVDECSMVGKELFGYIEDAARTYGVKVIFMGDPAQLPPVGEANAPAFEVPGMALTQVMRQRGENPILGLCTDLREYLELRRLELPGVRPACSADGNIGLHVMGGGHFRAYMPAAFSHDNFDGNHDRFRIVAWTNEAVNDYNRSIQALRYPNLGARPFAVGEPVALSAAAKVRAVHGIDMNLWWDGELDDIAANTETEGTVVEIETDEHPKFPEMQDVWRCTVALETGAAQTFWTLGKLGKMQHDAILNRMSAQAKRKEIRWFEFWMCKAAFANLRPAYAMTAHKSQGSTFENVFVDVANIWRNPNKLEAMQCLYVACSRASHHLILNASG